MDDMLDQIMDEDEDENLKEQQRFRDMMAQKKMKVES
jgi:hypothetical protein